MKITCLYHNDADGRASAAIVRKALRKEVLLYEINYGDPVPWDLIESAWQVLIVDFSLPPEDMRRLASDKKLVWIDHHHSAIEENTEWISSLPGLRDIGAAACVLTWRYFFPKEPVPQAITLIGDRDAWLWEEEETGPFDEGLNQYDTSPDNDDLWQPLLDGHDHLVDRLVNEGRVLRQARLRNIRRTVDKYGYQATFEGYRILALNRRGNGDFGEYVRSLGYQLAYCYFDDYQNGELMTAVSLYSAEVDVSDLAQRFGGGGHRGAAGFAFKRSCSPFPPGAKVEF